jgi:signal transduction histidine kinase
MTNSSFSAFAGSTAFKITLLIAALCTGVLLLLNFLVINQSRYAFIEALRGEPIRVQRHGAVATRPGRFADPLTAPLSGPFELAVGTVSTGGGNIVISGETGVVASETEPAVTFVSFQPGPEANPLIERFVRNFQQSLLWVMLLGIAGAVAAGWFAARIITKPLRHLETGMTKLHGSDYAVALEPTGTAEVDRLVAAFNRLTDSLSQAEQMRKDLISDTSHELKTPITSLKLQLEGLRDGLIDLDDRRIAALLAQTDRLDDLVERLQEYARLRSQAQKLKAVNFRLRPFVDDLLGGYRERFAAAKLAVGAEIPDDAVLTADKKLLTRLLVNLVENVLHYADATRLTIAFRDGLLTVADDGVGIPQVHLDHVFERFYRVDQSRTRDTGGLGLGLAIVREIAEAHGWTVEAGPGPRGKGVRFTVNTGQLTAPTPSGMS